MQSFFINVGRNVEVQTSDASVSDSCLWSLPLEMLLIITALGQILIFLDELQYRIQLTLLETAVGMLQLTHCLFCQRQMSLLILCNITVHENVPISCCLIQSSLNPWKVFLPAAVMVNCNLSTIVFICRLVPCCFIILLFIYLVCSAVVVMYCYSAIVGTFSLLIKFLNVYHLVKSTCI